MDVLAETRVCRFEDFLLDLDAQTLFRLDENNAPSLVPLGSRTIAILCLLVGHRSRPVSKQEIMNAVWPGMAVEDSNLTVQMSALRRVLDAGRAQGSCIQTIPGRGYRFMPRQTPSARPAGTATDRDPRPTDDQPEFVKPGSPGQAVQRRRWPGSVVWPAVVSILTVVILASFVVWVVHPSDTRHPRLSIVVLPFENLSGNQSEDYLADSITDDLTSDLSRRLWDGVVISRESAYSYKGRHEDPKLIGGELGVRYIVEGSVRKLGEALRINAQLISTETRANLWADHFDKAVKNIGISPEEIVQQLGNALGLEMTRIEAERSGRERPANPDAFDLTLRARSMYHQPYSTERNAQVIGLYQQALKLDPTSAVIRLELAAALLDEPDYENDLDRAGTLISEAASISPGSYGVLSLRADLLRMQGNWPEAMAAAQRMIDLNPNDVYGYNHLAAEKLATGAAEEAIPLFEKAIQLDPRSGYLFNRLRRIGYCLLVLGRHQEAIPWLQRALIANPDAPAILLAINRRWLAAAYALSGQLDDAHREITEANHLWPFATIRSESPQYPSEITSAQTRHYQQGLRLAGLRDHADENANFDVAPDAELLSGTGEFGSSIAGYTPTTAPGVTTIGTVDLVALRTNANPIIIDTVSNFWGRSIPDAVGLKASGQGNDFSDPIQGKLRHKMRTLTSGKMSTPIVAVGWNSERFDGRNLALRLVAMGYTHVYWYRGGREAWEVNGLSETEMAPADW